MSTIISLLKYPMAVITLCSILYGYIIVKSLFCLIFKKDNSELIKSINELRDMAKKNIFGYSVIFFLIILITVLSSSEIMWYLGYKDLNNIPYGTYTYYVEMNKDSSSSVYTEPAIVTKDSFCIESDENHEKCYVEYHLDRIYFSNGGYISFNDFNELHINKVEEVTDSKGDTYSVKLLNKHAYIKNVIESHPSFFQILFVVIMIAIELICWLIPLYKINIDKKNLDKLEQLISKLMVSRMKKAFKMDGKEFTKSAVKRINSIKQKDRSDNTLSETKLLSYLDSYKCNLIYAKNNYIAFEGTYHEYLVKDISDFESALSNIFEIEDVFLIIVSHNEYLMSSDNQKGILSDVGEDKLCSDIEKLFLQL